MLSRVLIVAQSIKILWIIHGTFALPSFCKDFQRSEVRPPYNNSCHLVSVFTRVRGTSTGACGNISPFFPRAAPGVTLLWRCDWSSQKLLLVITEQSTALSTSLLPGDCLMVYRVWNKRRSIRRFVTQRGPLLGCSPGVYLYQLLVKTTLSYVLRGLL